MTSPHASAAVPKTSDFAAPIAVKARKAPQPDWVAPMLATLTERRFTRKGWLFEPKFDGERCLVFCRNRRVRLMSRNQKLLNEQYPELVRAFETQNSLPFIMDGEIVSFQGSRTSFARLQQRMHVRPSPELLRKVPVHFCAFDLLYFDGYELRDVPLRDRKQALRERFKYQEPLLYTKHRDTEGEAYYQQACRERLEGIIAKNGSGRYISRRSSDWLKFKCVNEQEFVVGGFTDRKGSLAGFGALLVGYYDQGKLIFAGKVGTGYDTSTLNSLRKRLSAIETKTCPFDGGDPPRGVHWVKPALVIQTGFGEWTPDGKLRHPRYLGLRDDKGPEHVVREG